MYPLDQRGHGKSFKPAQGYSIETMAEDLYQLLCHLNVSQAHIGGASMGGEGSLEGIIQSVMNTQTAHAEALLVDRRRLRAAQEAGDIILANRTLMEAYETDVQPLLKQARVEMGLHPDPIIAFRESGYLRKIAAERVGEGLGSLGGG